LCAVSPKRRACRYSPSNPMGAEREARAATITSSQPIPPSEGGEFLPPGQMPVGKPKKQLARIGQSLFQKADPVRAATGRERFLPQPLPPGRGSDNAFGTDSQPILAELHTKARPVQLPISDSSTSS